MEEATMTTEHERLKEEILRLISEASEQRLRPHDLERTLSHRPDFSMHMVQQAIRDLVEEGKLAYTYRDPASYLELAEQGAPLHPVF
jgi:DNA-binding GntR family transcriptional regulator